MKSAFIITLVAVVMVGMMVPNISAVSEKMFGDDYYVDENFGFAIKIPKPNPDNDFTEDLCDWI